MTFDFEKQRQVSHVLIDMVAAVDPNAGYDQLPEGWISTFSAKLGEQGAMTLDYDGEHLVVDMTVLVTAISGLIENLVGVIRDESGQDRLEVLNDLRHSIDERHEH